MFWVSVWVLGVFEYRSRSQICTNSQNFFVSFQLIFQKFNHFHIVKITFFKDICRELHWKAEIFLSWTLFVIFWVSALAPGSKIDNFQFLLKFIWAVTWRLLKIQSWNFQDFHILLMQTPGPNIIKIYEGNLVTFGQVNME